VGKEVTNNFLQGYNGTIFAYGSTGSGKTYTMFGNDDGLVPSVVEEIFAKLEGNSKISCSMI
jgi:Tfp pilus assembly pilus retraction ATPase PilT